MLFLNMLNDCLRCLYVVADVMCVFIVFNSCVYVFVVFGKCSLMFADVSTMFDVVCYNVWCFAIVFDAAAIMYVWIHVWNLVGRYTYHWLPPIASVITCYPCRKCDHLPPIASVITCFIRRRLGPTWLQHSQQIERPGLLNPICNEHHVTLVPQLNK